MQRKDIKDATDVIMFFSAHIRSILSWPLRTIGIMIGFPNVKIVYKSGHVEYYFLREYSYKADGGALVSLNWETTTRQAPFFVGLNQIESIHRIY